MEQSENLNIDLFRTATGSYWLPTNAPDDAIIQYIRRGEIFDKAIYDEALKFIKQDSFVIDVGACYGQMSILFSKIVGQHGMVMGFEASPFIFNLYKKNISENTDLDRFIIYNNAVWDKSDIDLQFMDYDFSHYKSYGCFGIDPTKKGKVSVRSIKLDDIKFTRPIDFIKIDVQGADLHALRGAEKTLRTHRCPVIFEYEGNYDESFGVTWQAYIDFIEKVDYRIVKNVNDWNFLIMSK